jgi:hypothetical protein
MIPPHDGLNSSIQRVSGGSDGVVNSLVAGVLVAESVCSENAGGDGLLLEACFGLDTRLD